MMPVMIAILLTQAVSTVPQIQIQKNRAFSCEARDRVGAVIKISGEITNWEKHERNEAGRIMVRADRTDFPNGSFLAISRGNDVSLSNYLENPAQRVRIGLIVGDNREAIMSVEIRGAAGSKEGARLYTGFCTGEYTGAPSW